MEEKRKICKKYFSENGFYVSDGLKYGMDFLLYTDKPSNVHSKYGVIISRKSIKYQDLISYQRVCCSNNKELVIADLSENREVKLVRVLRFKAKNFKEFKENI